MIVSAVETNESIIKETKAPTFQAKQRVASLAESNGLASRAVVLFAALAKHDFSDGAIKAAHIIACGTHDWDSAINAVEINTGGAKERWLAPEAIHSVAQLTKRHMSAIQALLVHANAAYLADTSIPTHVAVMSLARFTVARVRHPAELSFRDFVAERNVAVRTRDSILLHLILDCTVKSPVKFTKIL